VVDGVRCGDLALRLQEALHVDLGDRAEEHRALAWPSIVRRSATHWTMPPPWPAL
jgi:hypothetical protein